MEFCQECGKRLMVFPQEGNSRVRIFCCLNCNKVFVGQSDKSNSEIRVVVSLKKITCRQLLISYRDADPNLAGDINRLLTVCGKRSVDDKMIFFATKIVNVHLISSSIGRGNKPKVPYELEQTLKMWVPSIPIYDF